ncbi:TlpA family protein disulfide reductase [Roseospira marina]|uniref:TlpA family protein disulfide reductase n=1 Tax=Roseospira marina TaxID=140057 RepID=A0A5M6IE33_9PROT|nr:TlpA disulfide reductase family protein [Roseospira marina]KAA5606029.1 TlpA family protein disulfide reductase [Roseospira marina]MBB4313110.1 thiol-disulfide isomerase/thioredoxin [Roseospira marina]MBB5086149.1 thiol-disulfide isomerase/thioredoxin [Roseospira marina]
MSRFRRLCVAPVLGAVLLALSACDDGAGDGGLVTGATEGKRPPSVALEAVQDPEGAATAGLEAYRGKILVLGFWLGGCAPCLTEMPELVELHKAYADQGVEVLLVNVGGSPPTVRRAISDFGMRFGMTLDTLALTATRFKVGVFPTTFVIDREGVIRARLAGNRKPGTIKTAVDGLLS